MVAIAVAAVIMAAVFLFSILNREKEPEVIVNMNCAIAKHNDTKKLLAGYNYYLLRKYASHTGKTVSIKYIQDRKAALDSLRRGSIDLLAFPWQDTLLMDSLVRDSIILSPPIDSICVWLTKAENRPLAREAGAWLEEFQLSELHEEQKIKFFGTYNPYRSRKRLCLSPYDSLFRHHADSIGWDWRLLAAVSWHESHFHIEARSRRGASGIMQLVPSTAKRFGVTEPLDPEQSIMAATRYLGMLQKRFRKVAANPVECHNYAMAAYNAGEGRIDDCISFARSLGVDPSFWYATTTVIPLMSDKESLDTSVVKIGRFRGMETIRYVDEIYSIYEEFCRIYPEKNQVR